MGKKFFSEAQIKTIIFFHYDWISDERTFSFLELNLLTFCPTSQNLGSTALSLLWLPLTLNVHAKLYGILHVLRIHTKYLQASTNELTVSCASSSKFQQSTKCVFYWLLCCNRKTLLTFRLIHWFILSKLTVPETFWWLIWFLQRLM